MKLAGRPILVTGATGYVASRLIPALLAEGALVRATSRHPEAVARRHPEVEVVPSDVLDEGSLVPALEGVATAYYLVHSMSESDFEASDRAAAETFRSAAEKAGVIHLVYLGGLAHGDDLTPHLRSRQAVGEVLASGQIPVTELRAALVVGSGSIGFEILRHLAERLPAMIAPRWLDTKSQPIAEADIVNFLVDAAIAPPVMSEVFEVGGADVVSYREMIDRYMECRGLKRPIVRVPVLTPRLSSYWLHLVTPGRVSVARPLIEGLRHEMVVRSNLVSTRFPNVRPMGIKDAIESALSSQTESIERGTSRADSWPGELSGVTGTVDEEEGTGREQLARRLGRLGADPGWYALRLLWRKPGRAHVGVGEGQQREDAERRAHAGWKVLDRTEERVLLGGDAGVPGDAFVEYRIVERDAGAVLRQSVYFRPRGVMGRLYWWSTYPAHRIIFKTMVRRLARRD